MVQFYPWFKFYVSFVFGCCMIMSLKHRKIKFEPRIKLNHNIYAPKIACNCKLKKSCTSKNRMCARKLETFAILDMYELDLLFFYCWQFIILKNSLQYNGTKIPHSYQQQANSFISITTQTDPPDMRLHNQNI